MYYKYKSQNYDYKISADSIEVLNHHTNKLRQSLYRLKQRFVNTYNRLLPEKNAGVLSAMILGEKQLLDQELKDIYQQNGISHILAISGLHVSLLGLSLYKLFRKSRIPILPTTLICVLFLTCYGILTNFSVSTNRAVVMSQSYPCQL